MQEAITIQYTSCQIQRIVTRLHSDLCLFLCFFRLLLLFHVITHEEQSYTMIVMKILSWQLGIKIIYLLYRPHILILELHIFACVMLLIEANLPSGSRWWFPPYFSFGQLAQLLVSLLSVCVHELHWREGCLFVWLFSLNIDRLSPESLTPPLASHCFYYVTHLEHFIVISLNTDCKVQCATKGENQHDVKTCVNSTDIKLMVFF